jgi:hypothetical protein
MMRWSGESLLTQKAQEIRGIKEGLHLQHCSDGLNRLSRLEKEKGVGKSPDLLR